MTTHAPNEAQNAVRAHTTSVNRASSAVSSGSSALDVPVTIVVPTYKERDNLPHLIEKLGQMRDISGLDIDLLIMDDNSRDGSAEFVEGLGLSWAKLVTRTTDRGLSPSVVDGLRRARGKVLVVMDADLSHPPEKVPELVRAVAAGDADFVIGSRYVAGASTDENWGLFRWLNSKVATLIARPLTSAKDPMAASSHCAGRRLIARRTSIRSATRSLLSCW
jgi:dolichol-phosphate mannosyltransferase